jgi:hypothetical protein
MSMDQLDHYTQFTWVWCIFGQMEKIRQTKHIECSRCPRWFESYEIDPANGDPVIQATHCCAWSFYKDGRWQLACGYGSSYDMNLYWYIDNFPLKAQDPICDYCIEDMLSNGTLINTHAEEPGFPKCTVKEGCTMVGGHDGDCYVMCMVKL